MTNEYKILVTTIATRQDAISVDTKVIEVEYRSEADIALTNLATTYTLGTAIIKQTAEPINFKRNY